MATVTDISDVMLSDETRMIRDETRRFVEQEVTPEARERDADGRDMSRALIDTLGEMGFFGILIDEEYG